MPSTKKTLHFMSSALVTAIAVGLLGFGMSADWAVIKMDCARGGSNLFNGTAKVTLGLFYGRLSRDSCPAFLNEDGFQVFPGLSTSSVPKVLQALVVCLLVFCMVCSAGTLLISLYNSVSNPYETYLGPSVVYGFSSLSACVGLVALIIFALNMTVTNMGETLVETVTQGMALDLRNKRTVADIGLYVVVPYIVLSVLAIVCVFTYQRAAYTHKREQERPTEDAPKEIMMY